MSLGVAVGSCDFHWGEILAMATPKRRREMLFFLGHTLKEGNCDRDSLQLLELDAVEFQLGGDAESHPIRLDV
jgi:hypothetical protein